MWNGTVRYFIKTGTRTYEKSGGGGGGGGWGWGGEGVKNRGGG